MFYISNFPDFRTHLNVSCSRLVSDTCDHFMSLTLLLLYVITGRADIVSSASILERVKAWKRKVSAYRNKIWWQQRWQRFFPVLGVPPQVLASGLRFSPDRSPQGFNGCIHNVQINGEPQDLSYPATGAGHQVLVSITKSNTVLSLLGSHCKVKIRSSAEQHFDLAFTISQVSV